MQFTPHELNPVSSLRTPITGPAMTYVVALILTGNGRLAGSGTLSKGDRYVVCAW
jgi:hypothetical protein